MVDDILFSKYILNQLEPEEMDKVEKMLIDDNEAEAIVHASIAYSQENIDLISEFLDEDEMNFVIYKIAFLRQKEYDGRRCIDILFYGW